MYLIKILQKYKICILHYLYTTDHYLIYINSTRYNRSCMLFICLFYLSYFHVFYWWKNINFTMVDISLLQIVLKILFVLYRARAHEIEHISEIQYILFLFKKSTRIIIVLNFNFSSANYLILLIINISTFYLYKKL